MKLRLSIIAIISAVCAMAQGQTVVGQNEKSGENNSEKATKYSGPRFDVKMPVVTVNGRNLTVTIAPGSGDYAYVLLEDDLGQPCFSRRIIKRKTVFTNLRPGKYFIKVNIGLIKYNEKITIR